MSAQMGCTLCPFEKDASIHTDEEYEDDDGNVIAHEFSPPMTREPESQERWEVFEEEGRYLITPSGWEGALVIPDVAEAWTRETADHIVALHNAGLAPQDAGVEPDDDSGLIAELNAEIAALTTRLREVGQERDEALKGVSYWWDLWATENARAKITEARVTALEAEREEMRREKEDAKDRIETLEYKLEQREREEAGGKLVHLAQVGRIDQLSAELEQLRPRAALASPLLATLQGEHGHWSSPGSTDGHWVVKLDCETCELIQAAIDALPPSQGEGA